MKYRLVIFDFAGTLFFDPSVLIEGAEELLEFVQQRGLKMAAVTAGTYDTSQINALGLDKYIDPIRIVGWNESKSPKLYQEVIDHFGLKSNEVVGVGDLLHREISSLNQLGATTIWVRNFWNSARVPDNPNQEPNFIANDLHEVKEIIEELCQS